MKLSGVDPGIIRELSGIYKPFIKAFKELVSNAFDADAKTITINVDPEFASIDVLDDGNGMTPFDFHRDYTRIGGSSAWLRGGRSPGGRARIGYKGIGFLAVARYCEQLRVETHATRPFRGSTTIVGPGRKRVPLIDLVGDVVPIADLSDHFSLTKASFQDGKRVIDLRIGRDLLVDAEAIVFATPRASRARTVDIDYEIDCSHLLLKATLDFDYLLGLEHRADLRVLDDFCSVKLANTTTDASYTRIRLHKLKEFAARELAAPAAKGKARNIAFKSGKEQFLWRLARSAPIRDDIPEDVSCEPIQSLAKRQSKLDLPNLEVKWRNEELIQLRRPVYIPRSGGLTLDEGVLPVDVREGDLQVVGYVLARSEVIYPAELRGLAVRVRNVMIGDASFLGWETLMSGPRKAAMSQITGELLVLTGLDAADAVNPGRESFYEESEDYRALRRTLFGSDATIGGLVGQAIRVILDRIHVRSQVTDRIVEARRRRSTLEAVSSAVNHYSRANPKMAASLAAFFRERVEANGLASARDVVLRPQHKIGGFEVEEVSGLDADYQVDFGERRVRLDFTKDLWDTTVYLDGHYYDVHLKQGKPDHPICEFDNRQRKIFVNWAHPAKQHMDDIGFLKSAILLRLASHAAPKDANAMMDLALNMLAFRAE